MPLPSNVTVPILKGNSSDGAAIKEKAPEKPCPFDKPEEKTKTTEVDETNSPADILPYPNKVLSGNTTKKQSFGAAKLPTLAK